MATQQLLLSSNARFKSSIAKESLLSRFTGWCASQENNRMLWVGTALGLQGCVITPITLFFVFFAGVQTWMLAMAASSIMLTLVAVLSAIPMKNAIPVFMFSFFINLSLITTAIISGLDISKYF